MAEKERKYKLSFRFVPTQCVIENSKQIAKKFKKLKNIVTASFQAKMGRERLRKKEKKIIVLTNSYPTRNRKLQKNCKTIQKIKKNQYGFFS